MNDQPKTAQSEPLPPRCDMCKKPIPPGGESLDIQVSITRYDHDMEPVKTMIEPVGWDDYLVFGACCQDEVKKLYDVFVQFTLLTPKAGA